MNMQAMLKQAQKLQKDMMNEKETIDNKIFEGKSELVSVQVKGNKQIVKVNFLTKEIESDDLEVLEDMIVIAINNAIKQIDEETEQKMGKYTQGMPGLF